MASLPFTCPLPPRGQLLYPSNPLLNMICPNDLRPHKWYIRAVSKKNASQLVVENPTNEESSVKSSKKAERAPRRSRKKVAAETVETSDRSSLEAVSTVSEEETSAQPVSAEETKKVSRRARKKATSISSSEEESVQPKASKRRSKKKTVEIEKDLTSSEVLVTLEKPTSTNVIDSEKELQLKEGDGEDISFTYSWPPLVCCFGLAHYSFIPSGRPANRLIDHNIHDSMKGMFWAPDKFIRAPGGPASSVAVALATIGGRVAFMGKLGGDDFGQNMLYYLNVNNVQTRSIVLDSSKPTALSYMKIMKRGGLRMSCNKPCAEDCLLASEINIDVLKEVKLFLPKETLRMKMVLLPFSLFL